MNTRVYGFTIRTTEGKERRAKPSGTRAEVLAKASQIIREDKSIKTLIVWTTRGKTLRALRREENGRISRME